jgi:phenylacetic acid degradation operon negative regulatory protein
MQINRQKKLNQSERLLQILLLGTIITATSLLAPQLPYLLIKAYLKKHFNQNCSKQQIRDVAYRLKKKKFIAYEKHENKWQLVITQLGKKYLTKRKINNIEIKKTKWDGKWRLVTFDIPEDFKNARHIFRKKLEQLGFFHFQRSVFILPYPCEKELSRLSEYLKINTFVHILTTERFVNDKKLVKTFRLGPK